MNGVKDIQLIGDTTYFLKEDGTIWACGRNKVGEGYTINIGNTENVSTPTEIEIIDKESGKKKKFKRIFGKTDNWHAYRLYCRSN